MVTACNQAGLGVAAVFGPRTSSLASHINSMCNTLEVPHLEARLEARTGSASGPAGTPTSSAAERQLFSVNLYPEAAHLSHAVLALIQHFEWKKFCIMYGDQSGRETYKRPAQLLVTSVASYDFLISNPKFLKSLEAIIIRNKQEPCTVTYNLRSQL